MRKFNISVNGKSYEVDVEEVGRKYQLLHRLLVQTAAPAPKAARLQRLHRKLLLLQVLSK